MGLYDKLHGSPIVHRSAGDYHATCKSCGKVVEGYDEEEVTAKMDRHVKRSHK